MFPGPFINEIFDYLKNKSRGRLQDKKLFLYSGHDITMVVMWRTLGFNEFILPAYGASLIWELHHLGNDHYVKVSIHLVDIVC